MGDSVADGAVLPGTIGRNLGSRGTWAGFSSATIAKDYEEKPTNNRHETARAGTGNIGSSRPSRLVNLLRSASARFMPGRPFVLNEMSSDGLKFGCLRPWSYFLCGILIQSIGKGVAKGRDRCGCTVSE